MKLTQDIIDRFVIAIKNQLEADYKDQEINNATFSTINTHEQEVDQLCQLLQAKEEMRFKLYNLRMKNCATSEWSEEDTARRDQLDRNLEMVQSEIPKHAAAAAIQLIVLAAWNGVLPTQEVA